MKIQFTTLGGKIQRQVQEILVMNRLDEEKDFRSIALQWATLHVAEFWPNDPKGLIRRIFLQRLMSELQDWTYDEDDPDMAEFVGTIIWSVVASIIPYAEISGAGYLDGIDLEDCELYTDTGNFEILGRMIEEGRAYIENNPATFVDEDETECSKTTRFVIDSVMRLAFPSANVSKLRTYILVNIHPKLEKKGNITDDIVKMLNAFVPLQMANVIGEHDQHIHDDDEENEEGGSDDV